MPIVSITDTDVDMECASGDGGTWTLSIAALTAGTALAKNQVDLTGCPLSALHTEGCQRTWNGYLKIHGVVNALHRALVVAVQTHATWAAALAAETSGDIPTYSSTLSATPIVLGRTDFKTFAWDTAAALDILGIDAMREKVLQGLVFTDDDDGAIGTLMTALFPSSEALRVTHSAAIKVSRDTRFV